MSILRAFIVAGLALACSAGPPPDSRLSQSQLRAFVSTDKGKTWSLRPEVFARGFDSLGLREHADSIELTGLDHAEEPPWWEWYTGPRVRCLEVAADGTTSRATQWVDTGDTRSLVDPQWFGDQLWFASRPTAVSGDPANSGDRTTIRVAPGGAIVYSAHGLADPSPVTFHGQRYVFATQIGRGVVQLANDPLREMRAWTSLTVPFATVVDDELWLLAQTVIQGRRYPVLSRSRDGQNWSTPAPMLPMLPNGPATCTSPVLGRLAETWWLFCVDENVGSGGQPTPDRRAPVAPSPIP